MGTQQIEIFDFESQAVRVVQVGGEPWFVAKDACRVLEIANHHHAIHGRGGRSGSAGLEEDEKGVAIVTTPSGEQSMIIVSESGLYALIFKSRKPAAKRFCRWVTGEVIPAIRRTGRYAVDAAA